MNLKHGSGGGGKSVKKKQIEIEILHLSRKERSKSHFAKLSHSTEVCDYRMTFWCSNSLKLQGWMILPKEQTKTQIHLLKNELDWRSNCYFNK